MEIIRNEQSPLDGIDVSFANYVEKKKQEASEHMVKGAPDYAFALDNELKQRMNQIPHFQSICRNITSTMGNRMTQMYNQESIAVGPNQYPEIYQMGLDCARRLGIGVPNIFIYNTVDMNALTYAYDNISPMIVLYSGLVERMTPGELKCVIGHECGHIHNDHGVYQLVIDSLMSGIGGIVSTANSALMKFWQRACEITADRAALICADDVNDAIHILEKLMSGAMLTEHWQQEISLDELKRQLDETLSNASRVYEAFREHPSGARRIFCELEFMECDVFYSWRPDLKEPKTAVRSHKETDERCKRICNILNNK